MIVAFLVGIIIAGLGIILSAATNNWQISLIISGVVAGISTVIVSILSNLSFILGRRVFVGKEEIISAEQGSKFAKIIMTLGIPNIIVAVIVYLMIF